MSEHDLDAFIVGQNCKADADLYMERLEKAVNTKDAQIIQLQEEKFELKKVQEWQKLCIAERDKKIESLTAALLKAEKALTSAERYLNDRGIRTRGTVGRTIVLPLIDEALAALREVKK